MAWVRSDFPGTYRLMLIRACIIAALFLIGQIASADEPAGGTIVLQLPPSMPPDAVRALVTDLAAKGAEPIPQPGQTADTRAGLNRVTSANLAARVWRDITQALRSVLALRQAPGRWRELVKAAEKAQSVAIQFWVIALAGLVAAPLIGRGMRKLFDRRKVAITEPGLAARLRAAGLRLLVAVASLLLYGILFWAALFWVSWGAPILEQTADHVVLATLKWRLLIIGLVTVVSPYRPDLRLLSIDDSDARTAARWLSVYLAAAPLNVFLIWFVERLGFGDEAVFGVAFVVGLSITAYKIAMYWAIRDPIARAILAATGGEPSSFRLAIAASWHWLFIALAIGVFVAATIEFSLGKGATVAIAAAATQGIIVILAVIWQASHNLIGRRFADDQIDASSGLRRRRFRDALRRLSDAFIFIFGAAWLAEMWGLNLIDPAPGSFERLLARPAFEAAVTIVGAWILWTALSAVIDERMPQSMAPADEDVGLSGSVSRVGTLLPLARNLLLISLALLAIVIALSTLGLDVGPLLAGLGVVGIAVGFGAQSLVRDVISGIFFLMEDAFRVGEYIDTGRLRGTVEGMSLRSVRLRHQNGQIHTIPFGQVQAVTNFSRDWSVVKFNLHLEPNADIEIVRRTVKRVGQELLDDPEIGADFIQPLKMQGVVDVLQTALIVRCKFTAIPVRPTYLQRQALHRLIEAFAAAELHFAAPNVTMQLSSLSVS
jgi:moderate conductance mechanosensitive channel